VLQDGRTPSGEEFDSFQKWDTNYSQDAVALAAMHSYMEQGYDTFKNNCSQIIGKGIITAGLELSKLK